MAQICEYGDIVNTQQIVNRLVGNLQAHTAHVPLGAKYLLLLTLNDLFFLHIWLLFVVLNLQC